jgi:hypothetical protein
MMEQLPLWMQYTIMALLGALTCGLCIAIYVRYEDWDVMRKHKERQLDYDRECVKSLMDKVYLLEKIHRKELKRLDFDLEKEIRRCNK